MLDRGEVVGTLGVLRALTSMDSPRLSGRPDVGCSSEPNEFDDGRLQVDETLTAELPRATVRIEASSSVCERLRWPLCLLLAVAALGGSLVLFHARDPSPRDDARRSRPAVTSRRYRGSAHKSVGSSAAIRHPKVPAARMPRRHMPREVIDRVSVTHGHAEWDSASTPAATPAPTNQSPAPSPVSRRRRQPKSEFSYLGR